MMPLTILSIAYPLARVMPDAVGGAAAEEMTFEPVRGHELVHRHRREKIGEHDPRRRLRREVLVRV